MTGWAKLMLLMFSVSAAAQPLVAPTIGVENAKAVDLSPPGIENLSSVFGLVPDDYRRASDGKDDAPSIQRAISDACIRHIGTVRLLARHYIIGSAVSIPCALAIEGQGWQEPNSSAGTGIPGAGTWLLIPDKNFTPITINGQAAAGTILQNFAVFQSAHPSPGAGWAPSAYPYVFNVANTNGEVTFRHIMMLAIDRGINANYAGRLKVEDLRGQFFTNAVYADKNYDTSIFNDIRNWPYWSQDSHVLAYQQANTDMLILGRVDDSFSDKLVSIPGRSVFKLVTTASDPTNPVNLPGGSPTNTHIGSIRGDFVKWTIWNTATSSQFDDVELSVESLVHQGAAWDGLVPIQGSAAIKNDGSFRLWAIAHLKADVLDAALVDGTASAAASTVQVGSAMVIFNHSLRTTCNLLLPGNHTSTLQFALPPAISSDTCTISKQPAGTKGYVGWNLSAP